MKPLASIKYVVLLALFVFVAGCTPMGLVTPVSPSQKLAYAYGNVSAVRASAAQALTAKSISLTDAQKVLTVTDAARASLDAGRAALGVGDMTSMQSDLAAATTLVTQMQKFLIAKGVK